MPTQDFGYPRQPLQETKGVSAFHLKEDLSDTLILSLTTFNIEGEDIPSYQKAVSAIARIPTFEEISLNCRTDQRCYRI